MQITINRNGENHGPYPLDQVREMLANGSMQPNDLAHYEGAADWVPLHQVPGVTGDVSPPVLESTAPAPSATQ